MKNSDGTDDGVPDNNGSGDLKNRDYIRYDSGVTDVPDGEAEEMETTRNMFTKLINGDFEGHGHCYPVTHAKTLGLVKGKLIVSDNLPEHLKQSMFARPGEYPVLMRYSTNNHNVGTADPSTPMRANTIKIFNVDGDRFPEGAGNRTQDFSFNSSIQVSELSDARTTREIIGIFMKMESPRKEDQEAAVAELKGRKDVQLQTGGRRAPNAHAAAQSFYSQVPYRFGKYVGKHALIPSTDHQSALLSDTLKEGDTINAMTTKLKNFYAEHDTVYLWQFQLLENLDDQPVEYAGKQWDTAKYPYQTVAKLVFPKQDSYNYQLKSFYEDHMRANAWRGLKTLEPLGGTNRLRRLMYPYAGKLREKLNGRKIKDVQHMEDLPGSIPEGAEVQTQPHFFPEHTHPEIHHGHLGGPLPSYGNHFPLSFFSRQ
jgi:hypothetical protein